MPQKTAATAWVSGSGTVHLTLGCAGLDRMRSFGHDPAEKFRPVGYETVRDLPTLRLAGEPTTLCRLCAVEEVVEEILTRLPAGRIETVFVTFVLSRPPGSNGPKRSRTPTDADREAALAEEASARLRRIADASGLHTTRTVRGPAAFGFVSRAAAEELGRVVHAEPKFTVAQMPDAELVSTFWTLRRSADRDELIADPQTGQPTDPWYLAEMICHSPA